MEEVELCKDCENYVRYYLKRLTRYTPQGGHCALKKGRTILPMDHACAAWALREEMAAEQEKSLKQVLGEMSERLNQIADILESK